MLRRTLRSCALTDGAAVFGDPSNGVKTVNCGLCHVKDVIGLSGNFSAVRPTGSLSNRMAAGDLLSLVDLCAARCATKHIFGCFTMGFDPLTNSSSGEGAKPPERMSVVTVSMDNILFKCPVLMGDKIDIVGTVVNAGSSSVAVNVDVFRFQFGSNLRLPIANAKVFMVAVDSALRPAKIVPAVSFDAADTVSLQRHAEAAQSKEAMQRVRRLEQKLQPLTTAELVKEHQRLVTHDVSKTSSVTIGATEHTAHRLFFPSDLNLNNTVFGGEILRWMEAHAVHCGRMFTFNRNVFAIGMHAVQFHEPVYKSDWMQLQANVVYVKRTTMEVEVRVTAERQGKLIATNGASFVLASLDETGYPLAIQTALNMDGASDEWLRRSIMAAQRYAWMRDQDHKKDVAEAPKAL